MKKICRDCNKEKEISDFPKAPTNKDGHSTRCGKCLSIYQINRRKRPLRIHKHGIYLPGTKEWRKSCYLLSKFGITLSEYTYLLSQQKNTCKICGVSIEQQSKMLSVDHDHNTGIIRGLLCQNCNAGIGFFKDNTKYLKNAIEYLNNFNNRNF